MIFQQVSLFVPVSQFFHTIYVKYKYLATVLLFFYHNALKTAVGNNDKKCFIVKRACIIIYSPVIMKIIEHYPWSVEPTTYTRIAFTP